MSSCVGRPECVVQPSEHQMYQPELVESRLDFCMEQYFPSNIFLSSEMTDMTMQPFFSPSLMSSQTSWIALLFPSGDSVSTTKTPTHSLHE